MPSLQHWMNSQKWTDVQESKESVEKSAVDCVKEPFLDNDSTREEEFDLELSYISLSRYIRLLRVVRGLAVINICLLLIVVYLYITSRSDAQWRLSGSDLAKATSAYSPILNDLPIEYHDVRFNGSLWPPAEPDWSRGLPGEETDALWEIYEPGYMFPITRSDIIAMGKDPETAVKFPDQHFHLGDDAYVGTLDVLHKIHCLNTLRRNALADYGGEREENYMHGKLWYLHIQHCVDMLAQDLQCHASTEVITYNWRDTQPYPFPDFSIDRKCRDFNSLLDWRNTNRVSMETWTRTMNKSELAPGEIYIDGVRQIPFEPAYYKTWGFAGSDLFPHGEGYVEPFPVDLDAWYGEYKEPPQSKSNH